MFKKKKSTKEKVKTENFDVQLAKFMLDLRQV